MRAMILAAGFGTRLGPLTDERPKPLLPLCNVPILRWGLAALARAGIREVVVNLHHLGGQIAAELGDGSSAGISIAYSHEPTILGTGGGLRQALPKLGGEAFVAWNGKVVLDVDLAAVAAAHLRAGALATMVVRTDLGGERWGAVEIAGGRVVRLLGTRAPDAPPPGTATACMFTGVQVLEPELVRRLPAGESCIVRDALVPALAAGAPIAAFVAGGYFCEHSTPERYLAGNLALLGGRFPAAPGPLAGVAATARVAAGARLVEPVLVGDGAVIDAGAIVDGSVVGPNARILAGTRVERSVVWPEATVRAPATRAIVTPRRSATRARRGPGRR
jgi:NDP-sugar pyrophosphorylase family protein